MGKRVGLGMNQYELKAQILKKFACKVAYKSVSFVSILGLFCPHTRSLFPPYGLTAHNCVAHESVAYNRYELNESVAYNHYELKTQILKKCSLQLNSGFT